MYSLGDMSPNELCGPNPLSSSLQISNFSWASSKEKNQSAFGHPSLNEPLKLSINGLSVGFPGLEKSSSTLFSKAHLSNTLLMNSLLFSTLTRFGSTSFPKVMVSITCTTSLPLSDFAPKSMLAYWRIR